MSHTLYFLEVLKSTEALDGATYLSAEDKSVIASKLLSELKPKMMTPGCDGLREITEKRIRTFIKEPKNEDKALGVERASSDSAIQDGKASDTGEATGSTKDTPAEHNPVLAEPRSALQPRHASTKKQGKGWSKGRA